MPTEKLFNGPADPAMAAKAKEQLKEAQTKPYEPADLVEAGNYFDSNEFKAFPMQKQLEEYDRVGKMFPDTLGQAAANKFAEYADTDEFKNLPKAEQFKLGNKYMPDTFKYSPDLAKIQRDAIKGDPEAIATLKEIEEGYTENYNEANGVKEPATEVENKKGEISSEGSQSEATPQVTPAQEYKAQSILEAWRDGKIDKSTKDYLIANTLATAAGNIGRLFNNVGAAYSGGTIDNNQEQSLWAQEQAKQLNPEAMDSRKMNRARIAAQNINNMNASDRRSVAAKIKKELDKVDPTSMEGERLYNLYNKIMGGGQMSILDMLGSGIMDLFE